MKRKFSVVVVNQDDTLEDAFTYEAESVHDACVQHMKEFEAHDVPLPEGESQRAMVWDPQAKAWSPILRTTKRVSWRVEEAS